MKKLLVILLLSVYGFSATGMTLHFHYCCGKLDDVSLVPYSGKCGDMTHSDGKKCCDEKQVSFKVKDTYHSSEAVKLCLSPYALPLNQQFDAASALTIRHYAPVVLAPPPLVQPLHILFCVFRI